MSTTNSSASEPSNSVGVAPDAPVPENDLTRLLAKRGTVRAFKPDPVPDSWIDAIIQYGMRAPTHSNIEAYSVVVDFITPETETSHWYHWGMARQFKPDDAVLTDKIREGQGGIFNEDMEMLQLQQANISKWPERKLLMLNIDSGGVQSRRIIDRLLAEETHTGVNA